jgi:hypothetical protein
MQKKILFLASIFFLSTVTYSQINAYANVTGIAGTTLNVNNVNETFDTYEDGEYIVIMQMQDNVIGGNTGNNVNFGNLSAIQSAGLYEVRTILSHTEGGGLPTSITVSAPLANSYNINANSRVQIISFPSFGAPNYTTTGNISGVAWNGNVGGIVAFEVPGTLTLAHNISVDGIGFRGGAQDNNGTAGACNNTNYRIVNTNNNYAFKGEGIYTLTDVNWAKARGKILNGGGGGNNHNGGGGGGGNYSAGGDGGPGWQGGAPGYCNPTAGGLGGISLSGQISVWRIFMGGGGGAGEGNNNFNTAGGNGGGIILIRANEIITTGACGGLTISANGNVGSLPGNDGAGAGGAAGSIVFEVANWNIAPGCPISIAANGGNGGHVNNGSNHGGGGGGGQGVVVFNGPVPGTNVSVTTLNGTGGCNNSTYNPGPCTFQAGSGSGANNGGVIGNSSGPLPIELIEFRAEKFNRSNVQLIWTTASEVNNNYFTVERFTEGNEWKEVSHVKGAGNSSSIINYEVFDKNPPCGLLYYRLRQTDFDGNFRYSDVEAVKFVCDENLITYPNPSTGIVTIEFTSEASEITYVEAISITGSILEVEPKSSGRNKFAIDLSNLPAGIYFLKIETPVQTYFEKINILK